MPAEEASIGPCSHAHSFDCHIKSFATHVIGEGFMIIRHGNKVLNVLYKTVFNIHRHMNMIASYHGDMYSIMYPIVSNTARTLYIFSILCILMFAGTI